MPQVSVEQAIAIALEHHRKGELAQAETIYRQILARQPDNHDALQLLGAIAIQTRQFQAAADLIARAIAIQPNVAHYHNNLGTALKELGRLDDAIAVFRRAIAMNADLTDAYRNLGDCLADNGEFEQAVAAYREALRRQPDWPEVANNLGYALHSLGRCEEAARQFRRAIELRPGFGDAHANLANVLLETGQVREAIEQSRIAVQLRPDLAAAHSNLLYALHFDPQIDPQSIFDEHRNWATKYAPHRVDPPPIEPTDNRKLRIGYVSQDFRDHPVGRFILPILEHHDRAQFEVHAFSDVLLEDDITSACKRHLDAWHPTFGQSDQAVADLIRQRKIDILIDLSGHAGVNRLLVFARKPASVQITYLGYPDTTGLPTMDYRITDDLADPIGATEQFHTEQLIRLPHGFLCYRPTDLPDISPSPRDHIVFGSFNNLAKISPPVLNLWAKILNAVPSSRLLIKSQSLGDDATRSAVRDRFIKEGIPIDRLEIRGRTKNHRDHLAAYADVDIALDTFPYNGTTTTCDALAMGVPVVTLAGPTHAGRMGVSILTHAGLSQWIANSPDHYIQIATTLATDTKRLAHYRATLRQTLLSSPLGDPARITHDLEQAFRQAVAQVRKMG